MFRIFGIFGIGKKEKEAPKETQINNDKKEPQINNNKIDEKTAVRMFNSTGTDLFEYCYKKAKASYSEKKLEELKNEVGYFWARSDIKKIFDVSDIPLKMKEKQITMRYAQDFMTDEDFIEDSFYLKYEFVKHLKYQMRVENISSFDLNSHLDLYTVYKEVEEKIKFFKLKNEFDYKLFNLIYEKEDGLSIFYNRSKSVQIDLREKMKLIDPTLKEEPTLLTYNDVDFYKDGDISNINFVEMYYELISFFRKSYSKTTDFLEDNFSFQTSEPKVFGINIHKDLFNEYLFRNNSSYPDKDLVKEFNDKKLGYKYKFLKIFLNDAFRKIKENPFIKRREYGSHIDSYLDSLTPLFLKYIQEYGFQASEYLKNFIQATKNNSELNFKITNYKNLQSEVTLKNQIFDFNILENSEFMYLYFKLFYPLFKDNKEKEFLIDYEKSKKYILRYISNFYDDKNQEYVFYIKSSLMELMFLNENKIEVFNIIKKIKTEINSLELITTKNLKKYSYETLMGPNPDFFMKLSYIYFATKGGYDWYEFSKLYKKFDPENKNERENNTNITNADFIANLSDYSKLNEYILKLRTIIEDFLNFYNIKDETHLICYKDDNLIARNRRTKEITVFPFFDKYIGVCERLKMTNKGLEAFIYPTFYITEENGKSYLNVPSNLHNELDDKYNKNDFRNFNLRLASIPYSIKNFVSDYYKLGSYSNNDFVPYFDYDEAKEINSFNLSTGNILIGGKIDNYGEQEDLKILILRNMEKASESEAFSESNSILNKFTLNKNNPYIFELIYKKNIIIKKILEKEEISKLIVKFDDNTNMELKDIDSWKLFTKKINIVYKDSTEDKLFKVINNLDIEDNFNLEFFIEIELLGIDKVIEKKGTFLIPLFLTNENIIRLLAELKK
jgi:hypothetical protein